MSPAARDSFVQSAVQVLREQGEIDCALAVENLAEEVSRGGARPRSKQAIAELQRIKDNLARLQDETHRLNNRALRAIAILS